jgi:uncharacterized protein
MKHGVKTTFTSATLLALSSFGPATASPLEDGQAAYYQHGDYATALRLLRPLAEKGDSQAEIVLGDMYDKGRGVPQDYVRAVAWLRKAADKGSSDAQIELGEIFSVGRGVPGVQQDFLEAAAWYQKAATKGNWNAQFKLGEMFERGQGVPQDYVQAQMWFDIAASETISCRTKVPDPLCEYMTAAEIRDASTSREEVAPKMTPDHIAKVQRMASEWTPRPLPINNSAPNLR